MTSTHLFQPGVFVIQLLNKRPIRQILNSSQDCVFIQLPGRELYDKIPFFRLLDLRSSVRFIYKYLKTNYYNLYSYFYYSIKFIKLSLNIFIIIVNNTNHIDLIGNHDQTQYKSCLLQLQKIKIGWVECRIREHAEVA